MQRTLVVTDRYKSLEVSPGVYLEQFHPGGKDGPNGEVLSDCPGGQVWTEMVVLGDASDAFQLAVPDIRLPANQLWPLHWHDCCVGIVILDGSCMIGDSWMKPGDVLITGASLEYGPLLIGPQGCRMFEIFAKLHQQAGGYAPEYHDHPTLQGASSPFNFAERSEINMRNEGRQTLPLDGVEGFTKGRLTPGAQWDLGASDDPDRGVMKVLALSPGQRLAAHAYEDWNLLLVCEGALRISDRTAGKDEYLLIKPNSRVDEITGGPEGALLLAVTRTSLGLTARSVA
ncbi:hypothetical protein LJR225_002368 [Phenylobacterium sp. LjRoot225]|uniref:hypothetical protein n=1 Tax=Phenylobacterium sp. LjRoot225 TaxID=3342285 RepID=UPI003ECF7319